MYFLTEKKIVKFISLEYMETPCTAQYVCSLISRIFPSFLAHDVLTENENETGSVPTHDSLTENGTGSVATTHDASADGSHPSKNTSELQEDRSSNSPEPPKSDVVSQNFHINILISRNFLLDYFHEFSFSYFYLQYFNFTNFF